MELLGGQQALHLCDKGCGCGIVWVVAEDGGDAVESGELTAGGGGRDGGDGQGGMLGEGQQLSRLELADLHRCTNLSIAATGIGGIDEATDALHIATQRLAGAGEARVRRWRNASGVMSSIAAPS